jgi:hypothetical protein
MAPATSRDNPFSALAKTLGIHSITLVGPVPPCFTLSVSFSFKARSHVDIRTASKAFVTDVVAFI